MASISTREIQQISSISNQLYTRTQVSEEFRIDVKPFVNRPIFIDDVSWSDSDARGQLLSSTVVKLPGDVIRSNPSLLNAMKIGAYYRTDLALNISVAGTISHAGCIIVAILPPLDQKLVSDGSGVLINTLLTGPHAFLYANEATSVLLDVPWYCNSDLATLDMDTSSGYVSSLDITPVNGNYATLAFYVLNPLYPSNGASKSLNIIVEAVFRNLDVLVPSPRYISWNPTLNNEWAFESGIKSTVKQGLSRMSEIAKGTVSKVTGDIIDQARGTLFGWLGLHNPNISVHSGRQVVSARNFHNTVDTQQFMEKLDPYSEGERVVDQPIFGTLVDEMTLEHILSKKQFLGTFTVSESDQVGRLRWARPISPYQGGLSAEDMVIANNIELLHFLSRAWSGPIEIELVAVMNNKQQVKLKLVQLYNPSRQAVTSVPEYRSIMNAPTHLMEFTAGGQSQVITLPYLCRNELTTCSKDLNFEGLFHGMYYIYVAQALATADGSPSSVEFNVYMRCPKVQFYGYATEKFQSYPPFISSSKKKFRSESELRVMNQPQNQSAPQLSNTEMVYSSRIHPIVSVRDIQRRMYESLTIEDNITGGFSSLKIPLSSFLGEFPGSDVSTPLLVSSLMYYGKLPGFKVKVVSRTLGSQFAMLDIKYLPPCQYYDNTSTVKACLSDIVANGDFYPLPFTSTSSTLQSMNERKVTEFEVPCVTTYKFVGGTDKYLLHGNVINSTSDCGHILIQARSSGEDLKVEHIIEVGLTDESRMGFHTVAPLVVVGTKGSRQTLYLGNIISPTGQPSTARSPSMYYGG